MRTESGVIEMKIRLLKPYQLSGAGEIIDPPKPIADLLIGRGVAVKVRKARKKRKQKAQ